MPRKDQADVYRVVHDLFSKTPFNQLLGLEIEEISDDRVQVSFRMRADLVGNYTRNILHGGVISAALDVTGGLAALLGALQREDRSREEKLELFGRVGTIDLRVHFLRPGSG